MIDHGLGDIVLETVLCVAPPHSAVYRVGVQPTHNMETDRDMVGDVRDCFLSGMDWQSDATGNKK